MSADCTCMLVLDDDGTVLCSPAVRAIVESVPIPKNQGGYKVVRYKQPCNHLVTMI